MMFMFAALLLAGNSVAAPVEVPAKPVKEKKICRIDPGHTGSRMKPKLCLTQTEWDQKAAGKNAGDLKTIGGR